MREERASGEGRWVISLMGPTASGKTDLAVELVERLPCEIVSVDSALVYRGMDIGTAKPGPEVLARAPHRLIDILDPAQSYSAARFRDDAMAAIREIHAAGRIPLLVGGTMLYFRALLRGLSEMPDADPQVRRRIEEEAGRHGWEALHRRLAEVDPEAAARIHPNDPQRIQRALEVYETTGEPISRLQRRGSAEPFPWPVFQVALMAEERERLHRRIALRLERMFEAGFVDEVAALRARGDLHAGLPSMRAVGYRQVWAFLEGKYGRQEMRERALYATRQLAKRQITWLRGWEVDLRLRVEREGTIDAIVRELATLPPFRDGSGISGPMC